MNKKTHKEYAPHERRKFERVDIARNARILVKAGGERVGVLRQIGRGGFMMEPERTYSKDGATHELIIHEPEEEIQVAVHARVLYTNHELAGFEFVDLNAESAVEIGIIIGKYYEHEKHHTP